MSNSSSYVAAFRFKQTFGDFSFKIFLSELLSKRWMEPVVPTTALALLIAALCIKIPGYATWENAQQLMRDFSELGFVAIASTVVLLSGGIDLSVGAIFALCTLFTLVLEGLAQVSAALTIPAAIGLGGLLGAFNGTMIGLFRARAFLITLVSLIVFRAVFDLMSLRYGMALASATIASPTFDLLGIGTVLGLPADFALLAVVAAIGHVVLSRGRVGWHLTAIGASRKAARHAGIRVNRALFLAYMASGALCGVAGVLYAARQGSAGSDTGLGWEMTAITGVVLGGVSLSGGRGTVARGLIGTAFVFLLVTGLVRTGISGSVTSIAQGLVLLVAVAFDMKWTKHKTRAIQKMYVNPTLVEFPPMPSIERGSSSVFAQNDGLLHAEAIGLGQVEGPEDVILDRQGRLYTGVRDGFIFRFSGPRFEHREVFARVGGTPLGMAFDRDENLIFCNPGMGLYGVKPDGSVFKLTDQVPRSLFRLNDDSRLRFANDLDIAPDGRIYFSDSTTRYEGGQWIVDCIEGRGNGRLLCHDPSTGRTRAILKDCVLPNGVCIAHDGQSVLWCSTWLCSVHRLWLAGPRAGETDLFVGNLPGLVDNINRASDGGYWVAVVALRTPVSDLAYEMPGFRLRMAKQLPVDEWLYPGFNNGCVIKIDAAGRVTGSLWDPSGTKHAAVTSMREHQGWLYLGGLENNRIGRIRLADADPDWTGWNSYWGSRARAEA